MHGSVTVDCSEAIDYVDLFGLFDFFHSFRKINTSLNAKMRFAYYVFMKKINIFDVCKIA